MRVILLFILLAVAGIASAQQAIVTRKDASQLERYASQELQRYLYLVTGTKLEIREGGKGAFVLDQRADVPGPQGYSLKRDGETVTIAGSDAEGVLYGVYGLLEDHYGIGFYLGGDVLPEGRLPLMPATLDETKKPLVAVRGILPWSNFPQSPSSYSWSDWKFIIDQMGKMRLNLLNIHNYNCQGHNEMFHNWTFDGWTSRSWMPSAKSGHAWDGPGWDVN
ncbi:MAG TPA: glycoside hydrolase family 20 zincin-like fold domain-containing protein, partial [Luteolibacter sp.]